MRAVVLVCALALRTLEARPDLGADADAVTLLDLLNVFAHLNSLANYFMTYTKRALVVAPASGNCVAEK